MLQNGANGVYREGRLLRASTAVVFGMLSVLTLLRHLTVAGAAPTPAVGTRQDLKTQEGSIPSGAKVTFNLADVINLERMKPRGRWYEATVPNTLDLAERTELSINALTGDVDPDRYYGVYQGFKFDANPPHVAGSDILYGLTLTARNVRTLPMLRAMNGSDFKLDVEYGMMRALMSRIRKDGRLYYPPEVGAPAGDTAYPFEAGMLAFAMNNWYYRDGNPAWLDWIDLLARGLCLASAGTGEGVLPLRVC